MKFISLGFVFSLIASSAYAGNSPLEKLPFDIVIGQTKNLEIENKGTCDKQIEVSPSHFRCEKYIMSGGKFFVYSSQNEIVNKVSFAGYYGHSLPQSWKNIGLKLGDHKEDENTKIALNPGLSESKFLSIIKENGAENIQRNETVNTPITSTIISFDVGSNHFDAEFRKFFWRARGVVSDFGLIQIDITEPY